MYTFIIGAIAESAARSVWPFHIHYLNCSGHEDNFQECVIADVDICASNRDAFLFCQGMSTDMVCYAIGFRKGLFGAEIELPLSAVKDRFKANGPLIIFICVTSSDWNVNQCLSCDNVL